MLFRLGDKDKIVCLNNEESGMALEAFFVLFVRLRIVGGKIFLI